MLWIILHMKNTFPKITEKLVNIFCDYFYTQSPITYLCIVHVNVFHYTFKVTKKWM